MATGIRGFVGRMAVREAKVEEELYHLIKTIIRKHEHKLDGVELRDVEPQYKVNGGVADLVVVLSDGKPLLEVECKRKLESGAGIKALRDFDPLGSRVISQALGYAVKIGSPVFATTNGELIALFRTPKPGEPFRLDTHRLMVSEVKLEEKNVEELVRFVAKWYVQAPVHLIEVDWLFISRLRSFVNFLSEQQKPVVEKLMQNAAFSKKLCEFTEKVGEISSDQLAREAAYLVMNKIVFYKILERHYKELPKLKPISAPDGVSFIQFLKTFFQKAIEVTKDFEPVFITGIYDEIPLPSVDYVFDEVNSFIEDMDTYRMEEVGSDVVGYIYEELIPAEERHKLGQFYTPPPIAELIVRWAVRKPADVVMDPAVGSGTFLVKAYKRLMELKLKPAKKGAFDVEKLHRENLSQLYADDVNPFPAHLTAMNLAMRDVRYPTSDMNIIVEDFFNLKPKQRILASYVIKTATGEVRREIILPQVDDVVANPPYTRWVEIPDKTKKAIEAVIKKKMKKYKLTGGIGNETGIYVHFIMYAQEFLKDAGRLGMIISNSWLQSDYGVNFSCFLLDHFKVKAVIDFNQRLFRIPLVATCVLLLEKEKDFKKRANNQTVFLYVDKEAKVDEILDAIENPKGWQDTFIVNVVKQSKLPRNDKWIKALFKTSDKEKKIVKSRLVTRVEKVFKTSYGNIEGVSSRGGTGGDKFFFLSEKDVQKWGLQDFVKPLLSNPRRSKFFTFTKDDWEKSRKNDKVCYVFVCHKPLDLLPRNVKDFISWGEKTPLVRVKEGEEPKTPDKTTASEVRKRSKKFFGWYDLGGVKTARLYTMRRAQYYQRFVESLVSTVLDDSLIALIPKAKTEITAEKLKALLAYLNSSFTRFFIETYARPTGGGTIELDVNSVAKLPILNITEVKEKDAKVLAGLFEKLEAETRKIGGADTQENLQKLEPMVDEIDYAVAGLLKLDKKMVEDIQFIVKKLAERRVARTQRARPENIKGEEAPKMRPPEKKKKIKKEETSTPLTNWIGKAEG